MSVLDPELLRRFYWLARAADEIGFERFNRFTDEGVAAVNALAKDETVQAQNIFEEIKQKVAPAVSTSLEYLLSEVKILNLYDDAVRLRDAMKFDEVVKAYQTAYELYKQLPSSPATYWAEKIGDIKPLLQQAVIEEKTLGISQAEVEKALANYENNEFDQAVIGFIKSLTAAPENQNAIAALKRCSQKSLEKGRWDEAGKLLDKAIGMSEVKTNVQELWELVNQLKGIEIKFKNTQFQSGLDGITDYSTIHAGNPIAMGESFRNILRIGLETSLSCEELEVAEKIIQIATKTNQVWGQEFTETLSSYQKQLHERIEDIIPHLLLNIYDLHDQNNLASSQKAMDLINRLKAIVPGTDVRRKSLESIEESVTLRMASLKEKYTLEKTETEKESTKFGINTEKVRSEIILKTSKIDLLSVNDPGESTARQVLIDEVSRLATDGLQMINAWKANQPYDPSMLELNDFFETTINKIGYKGWIEVNKVSTKAIEYMEGQQKAFDQALIQGDLENAESTLKILSPMLSLTPEFQRRLESFRGSQELTSWAAGKAIAEEDNAISPELVNLQDTLERDISLVDGFLKANVPAIYWQRSQGEKYFLKESHRQMEISFK